MRLWPMDMTAMTVTVRTLNHMTREFVLSAAVG
jgi:hypothetical protein